MSPNHLPIASITDHWTVDHHLLIVQAAIINQITLATNGTLVLDQVLDSITRQLQDTLHLSGCLMFQQDDCQPMVAVGSRLEAGQSSPNIANALQSISIATNQPDSPGSSGTQDAQLYRAGSDFYHYYQSKLTQGKVVITPKPEQQLPSELWDWVRDCKLYTLLMVPMLYQQTYFGAIALYQCEQEREWTPQDIAFVQAIAAQCAIALTLAKLEQPYPTQLKCQDLTDYNQLQPALQASIARNLALLEAIPDLIFRVNRDGICVYWKAAKEDALPIQSPETVGKHLHQILPTELAGLIWHHVELALQMDKIQILEYQLWLNSKPRDLEARLVKSGSDEVAVIVQNITEHVQARVTLQQVNDALELRVEERTAALREANHTLRAEIIERKRAEAQLKESEERFRNLVETSSDWVWEVDEHTVYAYASPRVSSLLGYEPSEVLGKTPFDFMPPAERLRVAEIFAPLVGLRQPFTCLENTYIHKHGQSVILERSGVPIFDPKGTFRGYRGIDRDITKRKKAEKEISFLHSITQAIFESQDFQAAVSVALEKVCEATGWDFGEAWVPSADGSVLECSPAWFSKTKHLEQFRRASEKLTFAPGIGLPGRVWVSQQPEWRRDVSTESHQIYMRAKLAREAGLKAGLGIPLLTPDRILAVLVFYMFESQDEDQRLIELIAASTELGLMIQRKQAEGEVRKALTQEKELTELKSRFISMTSHEFRTPLTTIQSSAELLEHYSHKWAEEKKLTHLHRIQIAVKHMTRLLNDILILGKADADKLKLNPAPLNLEQFCWNLVEELKLNDNNQHSINFSCSPGIGESQGLGAENFLSKSEQLVEESSALAPTKLPYMDEKLLRQILENLLSNAIKYSPNGSTVEFTLSGNDTSAVFQVCDQGIGIPPEDQPLLFETFHRATNVGTIAGTGLGLAIVKKCVDIYQGQIALSSEAGVGTTFTVTLPIYSER